MTPFNPDRVQAADIDPDLVRRLIGEQFPQWAGLPVEPVAFNGWDNRTYRLGAEMSVRLPSAARYATQVPKEHRWLPVLAPLLPLPIPVPLAMGVPGHGYPWHWSVYRWLDGQDAQEACPDDLNHLAVSLADFLSALQEADPAGGPPPGEHNFFRGGPLAVYDAETREALAALRGKIDAGAAGAVWDAALEESWNGPPVWVHGDVSASNLLVQDGRLSAVLDFGGCGVGDPACDLTIAWTTFSGESRERARVVIEDILTEHAMER